MKELILSSLLIIVVLNTASYGQEHKKTWTGKLNNGTEIDVQQLNQILTKHWSFLKTNGEEGELANLSNAELSDVDLSDKFLPSVNFEGAVLINAKFKNAFLKKANLSNALLNGANFVTANLSGANLSNSIIDSADFYGATLIEANLENTWLSGTDLSKTDFSSSSLRNARVSIGAGLTDARLWETDLKGMVFEIVPKSLPNIVEMSKAKNLLFMSFTHSPHSLIELREAFKKNGFLRQEKEITFAIKHTQLHKKYCGCDGVEEKKLNAILQFFFFEFTCSWGLTPFRPILIIIVLITFFSIPYAISIMKYKKSNGIWKVWESNRMRMDLGGSNPELLVYRNAKMAWYSLYFSILSAFNIGWRDFNIGVWIERLHPHEYYLKATGWVRVVSGIQSLISLYLLALTVLTFLGRPFDQF